MTPRTSGFHHVTMVSGDAGRSLDYYRDLLGLRLIRDVPAGEGGESGEGGEPRRLFFGDVRARPGTLLELMEWPASRRGGWGVGGVHHVALGVGDRDAQLRWKRRLEDSGVSVSGPYDRGYFVSIYFADPDGQILEIATAGPGYAIDEPADALGRELVLPPEELLRGSRDEGAIRATTWPEPVPDIDDAMRLDGIHHVSGITDDIERAVDWMPEALGLDLVKRTVNRDDGKTLHYFWAAYDGHSVAPHSGYTLFGWPGSTYRARDGVGQMHHVAFRAASRDELGAWRDHLLSLAVDTDRVREGRFFDRLRFRAPDGQLMEIATDRPGFDPPTAAGEDTAGPD